ncbi:MAG: hypothetical protein Q7S44_02060 [bacterium]|nr:hypothetical protein [bacterium]
MSDAVATETGTTIVPNGADLTPDEWSRLSTDDQVKLAYELRQVEMFQKATSGPRSSTAHAPIRTSEASFLEQHQKNVTAICAKVHSDVSQGQPNKQEEGIWTSGWAKLVRTAKDQMFPAASAKKPLSPQPPPTPTSLSQPEEKEAA